MITQHFKERFQERVNVLDISQDTKKKILQKCLQRVQNSQVQSESVCIHKFDKISDLPSWDTENELWITIRDKNITTIIRRDENHRRYTTEVGFNVEKMSYDLIRV